MYILIKGRYSSKSPPKPMHASNCSLYIFLVCKQTNRFPVAFNLNIIVMKVYPFNFFLSNFITFGSKLKGNQSPRSYFNQFERKLKFFFLCVGEIEHVSICRFTLRELQLMIQHSFNLPVTLDTCPSLVNDSTFFWSSDCIGPILLCLYEKSP